MLDKMLRSRVTLLALPMVAVGLASPALWAGWQLDDHFLRIALTGKGGVPVSPAGVFSFFHRDRQYLRSLRDAGLVPWWTADDLRLDFFRPLSSLTHWLDFALWPESAVLMHLHSLVWLALLVALAAALFRQVGGATWAAGLAALVFALDEAHGQAAGWISSRNTLVSAAFGTLAILLHQRWRQGWRIGGALAPAALLLSLLGGEGGAATIAYLIAHTLTLEKTAWTRRLAGLVPAVTVMAAWRLAYDAMGYGVEACGFYVDPLRDPVRYASVTIWRLPILLLGLLGQPAAEWAGVFPSIGPLMWCGGLALTATILAVAWASLRESPTARFWLAGMLLSLPFVTTTYPAGRLLVFASLGSAGLIGWIVGSPLGARPSTGASPRRSPAAATVCALLVFLHLGLAPLMLPVMAYSIALPGEASLRAADSLRSADLAARDLVVVNAPDFLIFPGAILPQRLLQDLTMPSHLRALATGTTSLEVSRPDERKLRIRSEAGFPAGLVDSVYRGDPLAPGERVLLTGMTVEVEEVGEEGLARSVLFTFQTSLEDRSLAWYAWSSDGYVPFEPPPTGETRSLPAPIMPF